MKQWAVTESGKWKQIDGQVKEKLTPGLYELCTVTTMTESYAYLRVMKPETDKLLAISGSLSEYLVDVVETFWNSKHLYDDMGILHKRGILMEGAPGTGKTAICLMAGQEIAKRGGVGIFTSPGTQIAFLPDMLKDIRDSHPDLPLVNIIEDIDKHKHVIDVVLPMLDGESQVSNIVHLATTNFVEKLDARLLNRPSRFDEVIKVKPPIQKARAAYFRSLLPETYEQFDEIISESKGLNFAHLKELAICSYVYNRSIKDTVDRLRKLAENRGAGFTGDEESEDEPKASRMRFVFASSPIVGSGTKSSID